jgi:hypothetical protein
MVFLGSGAVNSKCIKIAPTELARLSVVGGPGAEGDWPRQAADFPLQHPLNTTEEDNSEKRSRQDF